ncbi:hypothetical protein [Stygiolobus caldivivus]|uniref:Uncharacterized protein n=1 Tax=Stygiolobus caldivivus TaxID=2824673 RepID=A0A8D5ZI13_9CREN|nr:hypothetical protein [Stygiolobus caldivivus]BCU70199.1 hypothetical protein KN1_14960 [Stygiolobus caldivivus]
MTVPASRFTEPSVTEFLSKLNLDTCWLFNFKAIKDPEAFLKTVFFSRYTTLGFVTNENERDKGKQLVEIARKYNITAIAYLSRSVPSNSFLICVKEK